MLLTAEQDFRPRGDPFPAVRAAAAAPGGGVRADRAGRGRKRNGTPGGGGSGGELEYGQERVYAGMIRALVCQAAGDYLAMADALGHWEDAETLDGRSRLYAALWRPLLAEGLVGSGQSARLPRPWERCAGRRPGPVPEAEPGVAGRLAG